MHKTPAIRNSTDAPLKYSAKDVALHASADDCWVIVAGRVYDVTKFLSSHPGGAQALSKPGRAGCDVTPAFERIGHSAHARASAPSAAVWSMTCMQRSFACDSASRITSRRRSAARHAMEALDFAASGRARCSRRRFKVGSYLRPISPQNQS